MYEFGTLKQANLILSLHRRLGTTPASEAEAQAYRQRIMRNPQAKVQKLISKLNEELGFTPATTPASDSQRNLIGMLEQMLHGTKKTTYRDALTFKEADVKIRLLRQGINEKNEQAEAREHREHMAIVTPIRKAS
jgi:translation initiation factor 2B subunit (eIF-2B alpha/beta/delta family)